MEKDIGKIPKNPNTDIVVRIDDFGGRRGLTIREFVSGERYTGFTKAGTRIPAEHFSKFKEMINSISEDDMKVLPDPAQNQGQKTLDEPEVKTEKPGKEDLPDY